MNILTLMNLWSNATPAQLLAPVVVLILVVIFSLIYFVRYFWRSFSLSKQLKALTRQVRTVADIAPGQQRAELEKLFKGHGLEHVWREYAETLHSQYELRDGEQRLLRTRATAG